MEIKNYLIIAITSIVVAINFIVWFFPGLFINYMKMAMKSNIMDWMFQDALRKLVDNSYYIWFPRAVFGLAMMVIAVLIFFVYL